MERWRRVPGFPNYSASDQGRIRRECCKGADDRQLPQRLLKLSDVVCLRKGNKDHWFRPAQIILLTFVGPAPSKAEHNARHLDDDRSNNKLSNLAWGTKRDNYQDAVRNGTHGRNSPGAKIRGDKLRGRERPLWVRQKISATKRASRFA